MGTHADGRTYRHARVSNLPRVDKGQKKCKLKWFVTDLLECRMVNTERKMQELAHVRTGFAVNRLQEKVSCLHAFYSDSFQQTFNKTALKSDYCQNRGTL